MYMFCVRQAWDQCCYMSLIRTYLTQTPFAHLYIKILIVSLEGIFDELIDVNNLAYRIPSTQKTFVSAQHPHTFTHRTFFKGKISKSFKTIKQMGTHTHRKREREIED